MAKVLRIPVTLFTLVKIGAKQKRLAWPSCRDDMHKLRNRLSLFGRNPNAIVENMDPKRLAAIRPDRGSTCHDARCLLLAATV